MHAWQKVLFWLFCSPLLFLLGLASLVDDLAWGCRVEKTCSLKLKHPFESTAASLTETGLSSLLLLLLEKENEGRWSDIK